MSSSEGTVFLDILLAIANDIGIEGLVKLISQAAGGNDKVKAILDAEYAATDIAIDVLEKEKLAQGLP